MKIIDGIDYFPNYVGNNVINSILKRIDDIQDKTPFFKPVMPNSNKEFSVKITNFGKYGWVSDKKNGYHYRQDHPISKQRWTPIPEEILDIWHALSKKDLEPDCCLVNHYNLKAKMGLHIDNDEKDFSYPVLSISIGASALFRIGGLKRSDKTKSLKLHHGDVLIMSGKSRLIYHGIDKIYPNSQFDYRINLTLRKIFPG